MNVNSKLKISIITVCLNAEKTIEQSIISVISQNYKNIEYIIIDGGSTDGTTEIIKKYLHYIDYYISELDEGIYYAMNKGIKVASGDYIYFLGADDILCKDIIEKILPIIKDNSNKINYGQVLLKPSNKLYCKRFNKYKLLRKNISHQAIFYPRTVFKKYTYNCKYSISADWDLNLRLLANGWDFKYINLIITEFNTQGVSSKVDTKFLEDKRNLIKRYFGVKEYLFYEIYQLTLKCLEDLIIIKKKLIF